MAAEATLTRGRTAALAVAGGLAAAYLASRIAFTARFPYFVDEGAYAVFVDKASRSWHDLFVSYTLGREPLQTWLGIPMVKLGLTALTAVRIISIVAGLLAVGVIGLLGRRLGGNRVGLAAAALCVVMPFFLVNQSMGTVESMVVLIMVGALYLQIEHARRPQLSTALLLGLVIGAGTLTKESTKPALALLPLSLLCFDWSPEGRRERLRTWLWGVAIVVGLFVLAQLLLHASSRYPELTAHRNTPLYTVRSVKDVLTDPFGSWGIAWSAYRPAFFQYVSIPLLVAAAAGTVLAWRRDRGLTLVLLTWTVVPLLISLSFTTLPFPRHVLYVVPPALALMALALVEGADWITGRVRGRAGPALVAVAALLVLLPALRLDWRLLAHPDTAKYPGLDQKYVSGTAGGAPWPVFVDEIRKRAAPTGEVRIVDAGNNATVVRLQLGLDSRYVFVKRTPQDVARADFAITDDLPEPFINHQLIDQIGREYELVKEFPRPRGGAVARLYQRSP
jgi:4-amino-4-deoxy-L-arabinose transferase-like glycosyltransferase